MSGQVHGVGFRFFTQDAARREGLIGHVANQADGTVEAVAEGEAEAIERFERALRRGPARSRVERLVVDDIAPTFRHAGFEIR